MQAGVGTAGRQRHIQRPWLWAAGLLLLVAVAVQVQRWRAMATAQPLFSNASRCMEEWAVRRLVEWPDAPLNIMLALTAVCIFLLARLHRTRGWQALNKAYTKLVVSIELSPVVIMLVWLTWHTYRAPMQSSAAQQVVRSRLAARMIRWHSCKGLLLCLFTTVVAQLPLHAQIRVCLARWLVLVLLTSMAKTVAAGHQLCGEQAFGTAVVKTLKEPAEQLAGHLVFMQTFLLHVVLPGLLSYVLSGLQQQQLQQQQQQQQPTLAAAAQDCPKGSPLYRSEQRTIMMTAKVRPRRAIVQQPGSIGTVAGDATTTGTTAAFSPHGSSAAGASSGRQAAEGASSEQAAQAPELRTEEVDAHMREAVMAALQAAADAGDLQVLGVSAVTFSGCVELAVTCLVRTSLSGNAAAAAVHRLQQGLLKRLAGLGELLFTTALWSDQQQHNFCLQPVILTTTAVAGTTQSATAQAEGTVSSGDQPMEAHGHSVSSSQLQLLLPEGYVAAMSAHCGSGTVLRVVVAVTSKEHTKPLFDRTWTAQDMKQLGGKLPLQLRLAAGEQLDTQQPYLAEVTKLLVPSAGSEKLVCQLPLLLLPSEPAAAEVAALFDRMTVSLGGDAVAAYCNHFIPFAWDLALALGAMRSLEQQVTLRAKVVMQLCGFLADQGMAATQLLVNEHCSAQTPP